MLEETLNKFIIQPIQETSHVILGSQVLGFLGAAVVVLLKISNLNPLSCALSVAAARINQVIFLKIGYFMASTEKDEITLGNKRAVDALSCLSACYVFFAVYKISVTLATPHLIVMNLAIALFTYQNIKAGVKASTAPPQNL